MSKILNLWLVLETPDGIKIVKNNDSFFFGASNTVRQRAELETNDQFTIINDNISETYNFLFKSLDRLKCEQFVAERLQFQSGQRFLPHSMAEFDRLVNRVEVQFASPMFLINKKKMYKEENFFNMLLSIVTMASGGSTDFDHCTEQLRGHFTRNFLEQPNIQVAFLDRFMRNDDAYVYMNSSEVLKNRSIQQIMDYIHSQQMTRHDLNFFEFISIWKYYNGSVMKASMGEKFDPKTFYIIFMVASVAVERTDGKIWYKKIVAPFDKMEMDTALIAHCLREQIYELIPNPHPLCLPEFKVYRPGDVY